MKVRRVSQELGKHAEATSPALQSQGTADIFAGYFDFVFADLSTKLITYPVQPYGMKITAIASTVRNPPPQEEGYGDTSVLYNFIQLIYFHSCCH
jgi:hypothetical protein